MKIKILFLIMAALIVSSGLKAQEVKLYDEKANAKEDIAKAIEKAGSEGKHVFLQIGGNWCPWCIKFHKFVDENEEIKNYVEDNYVLVNVNYSTDNKNLDVMAELGYPQRFGFPVFVVLDGKGNRIHTQNSAYLEEDKSYNEKKVLQFFKHWSPAAIDAGSYNK